MNGVFKKRFRVESVLKGFGRSVFFTLTTPNQVDYFEIRDMWRIFRNAVQQDLCRSGKTKLRYVQCFEPHPQGHGWHIHLVIDCRFVDVNYLRRFAQMAGFGRVHIVSVFCAEDLVSYVSKYIVKSASRTKHDGLSKSRVRLLNVSRGLTRLSDIVSECITDDFIREIVDTGIVDDVPAYQRWDIVRRFLFFDCLLLFYCSEKAYRKLSSSEFCKDVRERFVYRCNI